MTEVLEWLGVIAMATLKDLPALGMAMGFDMKHWEIFVALVTGSMLGVAFFTFFGLRIRRWQKERRIRKGIRKPLNYRKARKWKRLWLRFGLPGIALLTPILFGPAIGALICVIFERRQGRIMLFMGVSIVVWCAIFALLGHQVMEFFH